MRGLQEIRKINDKAVEDYKEAQKQPAPKVEKK